MKLTSDMKKFLQEERDEKFLAESIEKIMNSDNIYLISKQDNAKHGATWPIFDDSNLFPCGHVIHLSTHNLYVLCHEIAHIKDFFRKKNNTHDEIFDKYWTELCFKAYEIFQKNQKQQ